MNMASSNKLDLWLSNHGLHSWMGLVKKQIISTNHLSVIIVRQLIDINLKTTSFIFYVFLFFLSTWKDISGINTLAVGGFILLLDFSDFTPGGWFHWFQTPARPHDCCTIVRAGCSSHGGQKAERQQESR